MRFLIALAFAAPLFAQTCTVDQPSFNNISAATFTGTVHVTGSCGTYSVSIPSQFTWLHVTTGVSGTPGDAGVSFVVDANQSAIARSGYMTIALINVTVTQVGANCTFGITPTSQNFPVAGGTNTLTVQANCIGWQATSNAGWISVPVNGISAVAVSYTVAANTCVAARSGAITVQQTNLTTPPTLAVTQDGSPNNLSLSAYSATVGAAASDGRITVTTGDGCGWTATTSETWIQITFGSPGAGNGGISYHLLANATTVPRTGSLHVGALTYTITQLAPAAPPVVLASVGNAADYSTNAVSPGEIVALFGSGMGPAKIVTLQVSGGTVTNSLAGTQVLFDGVAAPLIYTLAGQVSAVVPYAVAGKTSTQVQVSYQAPGSTAPALSNTMTMPVQAATPALFSLDSSGIGPGAILNQDSSINTTGNAAARLSVIALYCTGGGVTTPASADGAVIPDASFVLAQTPVVTIGGVNAAVKYAGAAPDAVAGLTQINVEVPAALSPAIAWPVIVKIGDFSSTGSVTVAVK
jgi:uncharacterized protein (TIGR03437 family)